MSKVVWSQEKGWHDGPEVEVSVEGGKVQVTEKPKPPMEVGDFVVESYGYDQTNVQFYKVVSVTPSGKSVRVQPWSKTVVSGQGGPCEYVVPGEFPVSDKTETKRMLFPEWAKGEPYFRFGTYSSGSKWNGEPQYQTGAGWGR